MTQTEPTTPTPGLLRDPAFREATERLNVLAIDFGTSSSTVTLFDDIRGHQQALRPAQTSILGKQLAGLLRNPDWPAADDRSGNELKDELCRLVAELRTTGTGPSGWPALAEQLERDSRADSDITRNRYREEDAGGRADRGKRLNAVSIALEQLLDGHPELGAWMGPRLHRAYDAAFGSPSLASYNLTAVALEGRDVLAVPSMLVVPRDQVIKAKLRSEPNDKHDVAGFPGLKRYLARPQAVPSIEPLPRPAGWQADTDLLIGLAYTDLVKCVETFAKTVGHLRGRPVDQATVTYPTTTPPGPRRRLRKLLTDALGVEIDTAYDEGVAAALFFVMRELGGGLDSGVEALRGRARPNGNRCWQRTMLVVDIGGGTTDIALVTLDLDEIPVTAAAAPDREQFRGRHYRLRPRILGTSGHAQLGGDLLTLKVFYWLKAALADAITKTGTGAPNLAELWAAAPTEDEVPAALAPLVVAFRQPDPAPIAVRSVLREILPTHSDAPTGDGQIFQGGEAFRLLWREAESAKRQLAAGHRYSFTELVELSGVLSKQRAARPWLARIDQLKIDSLDPAEFATLARPVLDDAMALAGALARQRLGSRPDAALDAVALSGRTCGMPVAAQSAREVLTSRLLDASAQSGVVLWDPAALLVETEHAKQAASIGACWARSNRENRPTGVDVERLDRGENIVDIAVDNLLVHLPCGFDIVGQEANDRTPLLEPGSSLDRARIDGSVYLESRWLPLRPDVRLHRRLDGEGRPSIQWGRFRYRSQAEREAARRTDGNRATDDGPSRDLRFSIAMDQELNPTLLLRRGDESHVVVDSPVAERDLSGLFRRHSPDHDLPIVPEIAVELLGRPGAEPPRRHSVFPSSPGPGSDCFAHCFQLLEHHQTRPVRGAIAAQGLPVPAAAEHPDGPVSYQLLLRTGPGHWDPLGEPLFLPYPDRPGSAPPVYWATLDVRGVLRIVRGYPPYLPASSLEYLERAPGAVYATAMDDVQPDRNPFWDPFNGLH